MHSQYNMRSPAVKRLMKEAQELRDPTELYHAQPLEDNLFEWHFTLRGPEESDFEGGVYHGRIILPPDYPMKPPSIILLTPNGRFETFKKICLSISGHHPESWQPSWSIRTALLAIIGFMPTHGGGAIGSLDYTTEERKVLAKKSQDWKCPDCGDVSMKLKPVTEASEKASQEAKELASQINFLGEKVGGSPAKINETDTPNIETSTSMATQPSSTSGITTSTSSSASTAAQASSPYQWTIPLGWGTQFQQTNVPAQTTYPRFPYPPPFMAPPPGMVQPPGRNTQGIPFFPPLPFFPPMLRGFPPFPAQPKNVEGIQGGTSPQSGSMCTTVASPLPQKHQSVPSSSTSSPSQAVGSESAAATAAVSTTTLTAPMPDTETVGGASSAVSGSTAATSSVTITDAVASTHTATTEASVSSNNPATDLRQRRTTQPQEQVTRAANTITGPAPQLSESNGFGTIVMIVVLSLAITVLLFRRVLIQYFAKDYQGLYD